MSGVSDFRKAFDDSAERLLASTAHGLSGLSSVVVDEQPAFLWVGRVVSAVIYHEFDSLHGVYSAEVSCGDSTKLITGKTLSDVRDTVFWVDKCLARFVDEGSVILMDDSVPCGLPF